MVRIRKDLLDAHINSSRRYWQDGDNLDEQYAISLALSQSCGIGRVSLQHFVDGILMRHGFKPEATNEDIYECIRLLGYEIVEQSTEK